MQKFDKMTVIAVLLIFSAGVIVGQGFSIEVQIDSQRGEAESLCFKRN